MAQCFYFTSAVFLSTGAGVVSVVIIKSHSFSLMAGNDNRFQSF